MKRPAKSEDWFHEGVDLYDLHNLCWQNREKPAHIAAVPDKSGHRSPWHSPVYNRRQRRLKFLPGEEVRVAGSRFRQRVEAIFESFTGLRDDLEQEKRAMQRIWAKREKQIDRVLTNTVGLHGDVAGIIGGTLPEIAAIELKALAAEVTNSANDGGAEDASSALTGNP